MIRPYLKRFTQGKASTAYLFPGTAGTTHHSRYALEWTHKVCQRASVRRSAHTACEAPTPLSRVERASWRT